MATVSKFVILCAARRTDEIYEILSAYQTVLEMFNFINVTARETAVLRNVCKHKRVVMWLVREVYDDDDDDDDDDGHN
jgi:hypothetical protein